ncbi:hypothetical protein ANCDUO_19062 [Ancylostoma duodenale]|uniref:Uncharacterized protein n=1 Tax=Ancylostoma duodenale TaxID=51022 RepID=A0A0C2FQS2_9BILA|nr:hypothetical protein ANCDUO_19062 [Ancylostoma duodenale]
MHNASPPGANDVENARRTGDLRQLISIPQSPILYATSGQFTPEMIRKRVVPDSYPLDDVVYLWANSPPFVNPVEVSNDLLSGPITFEEASAGDCLGNFTVGMYACIDVSVTFSGSAFGSIATWFLPTVLLLFRRDVVTSAPGVCCWFAFCLVITFLSLLEYFVVICCGIRRSIRYTANGHPEENPIGAAKEAKFTFSPLALLWHALGVVININYDRNGYDRQ